MRITKEEEKSSTKITYNACPMSAISHNHNNTSVCVCCVCVVKAIATRLCEGGFAKWAVRALDRNQISSRLNAMAVFLALGQQQFKLMIQLKYVNNWFELLQN